MVKGRFRSHPGEVLELDFIRSRGLTQSAVAKGLGMSARRLGEIMEGRRPITAESSLKLGRYFGVSAQFWIRLQADFDQSFDQSNENAAPRMRIGSRLDGAAALEGRCGR